MSRLKVYTGLLYVCGRQLKACIVTTSAEKVVDAVNASGIASGYFTARHVRNYWGHVWVATPALRPSHTAFAYDHPGVLFVSNKPFPSRESDWVRASDIEVQP